jgi:hypothetical protein
MTALFWVVAYLCGWYFTARWMIRTDFFNDGGDERENAITVFACWVWPMWLLVGAAFLVGKHLQKGAE